MTACRCSFAAQGHNFIQDERLEADYRVGMNIHTSSASQTDAGQPIRTARHAISSGQAVDR